MKDIAKNEIAHRIKVENVRHNMRLIALKARVEEEIELHGSNLKRLREKCQKLTGHTDNGTMFHAVCDTCGEVGG